MVNPGLLGAFILLLFIAVLVWLVGSKIMRKDIPTNNWLQTEGEVTSHLVRGRSGQDSYHVSLSVSYTVAGWRYSIYIQILLDNPVFRRIDQIYSEEKFHNYVLIEALALYPRGTKIPVYYNPQKPSKPVFGGFLDPVGVAPGTGIVLLERNLCLQCQNLGADQQSCLQNYQFLADKANCAGFAHKLW